MTVKPEKTRRETTPESAEAQEKERCDDEAVRDTVSAEREPGSSSILPGPPIPPDEQRKLREKQQTRTND